MNRLKQILIRINHKGYKAYKDIKGTYNFPGFRLCIDHVQGDPFASPSRICVQIGLKESGFPSHYISNKSREIAFRDFMTRSFREAIINVAKGNRGTGKSGLIQIDVPGQEILDRTSCVINSESIEIRFFVGLPAQGRTVLAQQAIEMFFREIPEIVHGSLYFKNTDENALRLHVDINEDQDYIRNEILPRHGLVAFVGDGSILPRRSGIDDRPMTSQYAVKFMSPDSLRVELNVPHRGRITGMGIKDGITLITGGGFHGKTTLLRAIERGVYNHVPGDGRELVVTRPDAVKIRAEDGRYVEKVDISPFIKGLPGGKDTSRFSTDNASGSTSQAANIIEALEVGSRLLLMDEDTSATNFMIRDERMQALVAKEKEPITPFVDKVEQLYTDLGCSTILVTGGSGDYLDIANRVLMMDNYLPKDVTERAKDIVKIYVCHRSKEGGEHFGKLRERIPKASSFDPSRGRREVKIGTKGLKKILFGKIEIDLTFVEQIVDPSQTRSIAEIIYYYALHYAKENIGLAKGLGEIMDIIDQKGLDYVLPQRSPDCARPRIFEIAAAINRMRSLRVVSPE